VGRDIRVSSHDRTGAFAGVEVNASHSHGIDEHDETALLTQACLEVLDAVQDFIAFETTESLGPDSGRCPSLLWR
jgi:hypothetical protein